MNLEGIKKSYHINNLHSNKQEDTNYFNLPKNSNNPNFERAFDKFSDKNVILNPYFKSSFIPTKRLSFKGFNKENYKELTDIEFEKMLPKVQKLIREHSNDTLLKEENLNINNILLANKILSNEKLYKNKNIKNSNPYSPRQSMETCQMRLNILDKFLSDEKYSNSVLNESLGSLIEVVTTPRQFEIAEKILSNEKLYNNKNITNNNTIKKLISLVQNNSRAEIFNKILSNDKLYNNENLLNNTENILENTDSNNKNAICDILTDIASDKPKRIFDENLQLIEFTKNGYFNSVADIIEYKKVIKSAIKNKNILKIWNQWLKNDDIINLFTKNITNISQSIQMVGSGTFEATFPQKISGIEDFYKKCSFLKSNITPENYEKLLLKFNPKNSSQYINLEEEIKRLKKQYPSVKASNDKKALENLQNDINTKTKQARELIKNAPNINPQAKIIKIKILSIFAKDKDFNKLLDLVKTTTKESEQAWNITINKKIFENIGLEYDQQLSNRLNLIKNKYLSNILVSDNYFKNNFKKLLILIKNNPNKSYKEIFNELPQNIETKKMFENIGIDYDKWTNQDKNSFIVIEPKRDITDPKGNAIRSLENTFNSSIFKSLPKEYTSGIYKKLQEKGYYFKYHAERYYDYEGYPGGIIELERLCHDGKPINFNQLKDIMTIIKEEMNKDIWTTTNPDNKIDENKAIIYKNILTDISKEIKQAQEVREAKFKSLKIQKADMNDISHSLFLGNDAGCCTAIGSSVFQQHSAEFSAIPYIKNKMVSAIEIKDEDNYVGNTMCYIAYVDNKPSLILDNLELKDCIYRFRFNNNKIRDGLFDYAKQLCAEIGKPDLDIYMGANRHDLDMSDIPSKKHNVKLIGSTGNDYIYLNFISSDKKVSGNEIDKVKLYKIE